MNGELNFEAMPFEAYRGFQTSPAPTDVEMEEEFGRQRRSPRSFRARASVGHAAPIEKPRRFSPLRAATKPPVHRPPFTLPKWPWGADFAPSGAVAQPFPTEPQPAGSEYMRWVQSALNGRAWLEAAAAWDRRFSATRSAISQLSAASRASPPMALSAPIRNVR